MFIEYVFQNIKFIALVTLLEITYIYLLLHNALNYGILLQNWKANEWKLTHCTDTSDAGKHVHTNIVQTLVNLWLLVTTWMPTSK